MTWEEWVELGKAMKKTRALLTKEFYEIPKSARSRRGKKIRKAIDAINLLRDIMDNMIFERFPAKPRPGHVFYGP